MEPILKASLLFDLYGSLLTDRQRAYYEAYYFDDLSLSEIGADCGVSAQAVADMLRRTKKILDDYEEKLGLAQSFHERSAALRETLEALERGDVPTAKAGLVALLARETGPEG